MLSESIGSLARTSIQRITHSDAGRGRHLATESDRPAAQFA
jgi:hypothetical protein